MHQTKLGHYKYTVDELIKMNISEKNQILLFGAKLTEIKKYRKTITTWIAIEDRVLNET